MAKEITIGAYTVRYEKGTGDFSVKVPEQKIDVAGDEFDPGYMQAIGASEEAIALGAVAVGGVWLLKNMNESGGATISIRPATGETDLVDILPGEQWLFRLSTAATAPYAISSSGTSNLLITRVDL